MSWVELGGIALGGAGGALVRALAGRLLQTDFPLATLLVNIAGSFLLACLHGMVEPDAAALHALLGAGFCGALTTFSTFILETAILLRIGQRRRAAVYVAATLVLCSLASAGGFSFAALHARPA